MLDKILKSPKYGGIFRKIHDSTRSGIPTAVFGVSLPEKSRLASMFESGFLYIVRDSATAKEVATLTSQLSGKKTVFLPAKDDLLLYKSTFIKESLFDRLTALYEIKAGAKQVVTTMEALLQLFPKKIEFLNICKGEVYDLFKIANNLINLGYKRVPFSENKGEFSIRGDILEIFPINSEIVYKIDFFDDIVERIRDDKGQDYSAVTAVMASDINIEESEVSEIENKLKENLLLYKTLLVKENANALYGKIVSKLQTDLRDDSLQYIAPLISGMTHDLTAYFDLQTTVIYDESKVVYQNLLNHEKEHLERVEGLLRTGDGFEFLKGHFENSQNLIERLSKYKSLALQTLTTSVPFFSPLKTFKVNCSPVPRYFLKLDDLKRDVKNWQLTDYTVLLCLSSENYARSMYSELAMANVKVTYLSEIPENLSGINVAIYPLNTGFIEHDSKLVVLGQNDLFIKRQTNKTVKKKRGDLFTAPSVGDFAVHEHFGVGLIKGVKKIRTVEGTSEYIELEYAGGDRLYVSTEQMDKLSKYLGGSETPTLNKIGGGEFERIKERVRQSIAKMTINLKKLYAERREKKGFTFSQDNALMEEFANSFEFEETEDQLISYQEIKDDMESSKVMDRLLCGDVGFGKTEVALRACFKAIVDGKQTAIVAPTTILSEQHFMTAKSRFEGFGIRIAVLNRFRTLAQQARTIKDLEEGKIDLIIGTHRLFSKDIKFSDLGLLVIDEEQRFGVEHKEKLKLLKENVDTLTLSATPIPRTLHLSLSGIRDISSIHTPPKQRIPVQTAVTELTDSLIKDAVRRELSRGGQVFILYNRVDTIYYFAEKVKSLVPNANIIVAHGQMPERTLENNISDFYQGKGDILIATTIIENGIDMPRANTLIVESSDRLGLSTLYQLKGRVGRGNLMAYAYFTFSEGKVLSDSAYKRLSALMEFTEMGSGYKIAMRDLELRGAGNVLGKEQHGHMDRVGYELYNKLLKEELGERTISDGLELDVKADAYIPDGYISNESAKMDAYKQIAEIITPNDRLRVENSLTENYGKIPNVVKTLIDIAELKVKAEEVGATKIVVSMHVAKLYLKNLDSLKDGKITGRLNQFKGKVTLYFESNPIISFANKGQNPQQSIEFMKDFLTF